MNFRHLLLVPVLALALACASASPSLARDRQSQPVAADEHAGGAWLGVYLQPVTRDIAESMDLEEARGALISEVMKGSPAQDAGLRHGDVIVSVNEDQIETPEDVIQAVQRHEAGDRVRFGYMRDGRRDEAFVTLGERPGSMESESGAMGESKSGPMPPMAPMPPMMQRFRGGPGGAYLGVRVVDLSGDLAEYFHAKQGALIVDVGDDSPAKKAGLRAGDVITGIDGQRIANSGDLVDSIRNAGKDERVKIEFVRKTETRTVEATLATGPSRFMEMPRAPRARVYRFRESSPPEGRESLRREVEHLQQEIDNLRRQIEKMQNNDR